jgi:hypothetical protein
MTEQVYYEDVDTGDAIPALTLTVDETQMFLLQCRYVQRSPHPLRQAMGPRRRRV